MTGVAGDIGGWRRGRFAHVYAAIDLGTNNCRLLVARASATGFDVIDAFSRPVRLGEKVADQGRLCGEAIERTMDALSICAAKIDRARVTRSRYIATEACRRADNAGWFLDAVRDRIGLDIECVSPEEEARLALESCHSLVDPAVPRVLLVDIGGGSTEVVWVEVVAHDGPARSTDLRIIDMVSIPWGVVTLTEAMVGQVRRDRPLPDGLYQSMIDRIRSSLAPFCAVNNVGSWVNAGAVQMIGASGTVTTMAAHHMGLRRYNRAIVDGTWLDREAILRIGAELACKSVSELVNVPCIGHDRADLALAGGAIFEAVCRHWPVATVRVADRGLREGVLADLMRQADRDADPVLARGSTQPTSH